MDTSVEYIEMCEKAQEIQKDWYKNEEFADVIWEEWRRPFPGGYEKGITFWVDNCHGMEFPDRADLKWVWLPRQDQLQEMVELDFLTLFNTFINFTDWLDIKVDGFGRDYRTYEKLWLAFIMKEKYNKQWNPETKEWEKV